LTAQRGEVLGHKQSSTKGAVHGDVVMRTAQLSRSDIDGNARVMGLPPKYSIEPMDLTNMRQNGVRSLLVMCYGCRHEVILNVDNYPGDLLVREFGPRMVCTKCGMVGADVRPNWKEQPARESLTGVQWRS
jgi:hypothetical protein